MYKVLIFTDLHITEPRARIIGLDPAKRFAEALRHALERHPDAAHVLITGDLTHHGTAAQYAALRGLLDNCPLPVTATLGNHDLRAPYFAAFPEAMRDENGFAQGMLELGPVRLIVLDTLDETGTAPRHGGYLCDKRLGWLRARLQEGGDRPVIIAMHHPPFVTGFDGMDRIRLANDTAFLDLLKEFPQVRHLICGHVHRTISGHVGGLAWTVLKSTCHQMPMLLGKEGTGDSIDEPGAYGVALFHDAGLILHSEDVLSEPAQVSLDDNSA
ncbi:MAG: phosphodiesterase [Paracoccaceae bacterium]|nr:phosphodiesterase [Paracoccaceae bacterium]